MELCVFKCRSGMWMIYEFLKILIDNEAVNNWSQFRGEFHSTQCKMKTTWSARNFRVVAKKCGDLRADMQICWKRPANREIVDRQVRETTDRDKTRN